MIAKFLLLSSYSQTYLIEWWKSALKFCQYFLAYKGWFYELSQWRTEYHY